jgi:hypothetical protein
MQASGLRSLIHKRDAYATSGRSPRYVLASSILEAVERRRRAMFVEWPHSKWHKPRRGGMFPLPIERHAAPPELRPFSLYVIYKRDAPLALNLPHSPLHSALGYCIANALGAKQPRPDAPLQQPERRARVPRKFEPAQRDR